MSHHKNWLQRAGGWISKEWDAGHKAWDEALDPKSKDNRKDGAFMRDTKWLMKGIGDIGYHSGKDFVKKKQDEFNEKVNTTKQNFGMNTNKNSTINTGTPITSSIQNGVVHKKQILQMINNNRK